MGPIEKAIADGTIHPEFRKDNLKVVQLTNVYDSKQKIWVIAQPKKGKGLQPIGNQDAMFKYETEEEAQQELNALNLWQSEATGNA